MKNTTDIIIISKEMFYRALRFPVNFKMLMPLSFSYKCDDYVSNDTEHQIIDKIRQSIMQTRQDDNDVDANTNSENAQIEDNSKDGSESGNSSISNTSIAPSEKPPSPNSIKDETRTNVTPSSSCSDIPSSLGNTTPDISESKPSKSTKVNIFNTFI